MTIFLKKLMKKISEKEKKKNDNSVVLAVK